MKLGCKKYVYLINDVTNAILKKDRIKDREIAENLRIALIVVSVLLFISIVTNTILIFKLW